MNTNNIQNNQNESTCCVDYCETSFTVSGKELVNTYKCNQKNFTTSDMWSIQKSRKEYKFRTILQ